MTDQLYCPKCGPDWHGAYDTNHRCVECGEALKAEKVMEKLKAVEEGRDALLAHIHQANITIDAFVKVEGSPLYLASKMKRWRGQAPATTLARLIAEKQAEALESLADRYALDDSTYVVEVIGEARRRAAKLRRSVEPRS